MAAKVNLHDLVSMRLIRLFSVMRRTGVMAQRRMFDLSEVEWRIVTHLDDLVSAAGFERHRALLESASLVFVDAAKDGVMERVLLERFESLRFRRPTLVVFDDIRVWNMLSIWRDVRRPKLDATSFGHWSGTGMIDWEPGIAAWAAAAEAPATEERQAVTVG